jgi:hypothetical protein
VGDLFTAAKTWTVGAPPGSFALAALGPSGAPRDGLKARYMTTATYISQLHI